MCDRIGLWHVMLSKREAGLICGYSWKAAGELSAISLGFDSLSQYIDAFPKDLNDVERAKKFMIEEVINMTDLRSITEQFFKYCEREECSDIVIAPKIRDVLDAMRPVPRGMSTYLCLCSDWA